MSTLPDQLKQETLKLNEYLEKLHFSPPVSHIYNPLTYAQENYFHYLDTYAQTPKKVLFLGMNPGPFGMTQTGIPFGEICAVRDWLNLTKAIHTPTLEHPKRPIEGFACTRSEVSGKRLWGLFAECFGTADNFFKNHFVANYCPLIWLSSTGSNITPDKLPKNELIEVESACLDYLEATLRILQPTTLIGVGAFAHNKLKSITSRFPDKTFTLGSILHPSPASPLANREWPQKPIQQLKDLGIL